MRRIFRVWVLPTSLATLIVCASIYFIGVLFGMAGGENWKIGYYGKFNRVKSILESIPGLSIVDTWQHHDVTMEDFGFTVRTRSGRTGQIEFYEDSPQMGLNSRAELQTYVQNQLPKN